MAVSDGQHMRPCNRKSLSPTLTSHVARAKDSGLIPGLGSSPGEGNGNLLQYSCLENPMDRDAWWALVHGVTKSRTWLWLITHTEVLLGWILSPVAHEKPMCLAQDALKLFLASLLSSLACTLGRRSGVLVTIHPTKEHRGASFDVGTVREGIILGEQPSWSWIPSLWQRSY